MVVPLVLQELLEPLRQQAQQVLLVLESELQLQEQVIIPWLALKLALPL